jgi:hypothetical protein
MAWQLLHNSTSADKKAMYFHAYASKATPKRNSGSEVQVLWHYRTGDVTLSFSLNSMMRLKTTIDSLLPNRTVRHIIVTQNASEAVAAIEKTRTKNDTYVSHVMEVFHFDDNLDIHDTVMRLLQADILVSMGSSLAYTVNLLQGSRNFVHFYFPPKEAFVSPWAKVNVTTEEECSKDLTYQTYYIKRGIVPVFLSGDVFKAYKSKMVAMLEHINMNKSIPEQLSVESMEPYRLPCWHISKSASKSRIGHDAVAK